MAGGGKGALSARFGVVVVEGIFFGLPAGEAFKDSVPAIFVLYQGNWSSGSGRGEREG